MGVINVEEFISVVTHVVRSTTLCKVVVLFNTIMCLLGSDSLLNFDSTVYMQFS